MFDCLFVYFLLSFILSIHSFIHSFCLSSYHSSFFFRFYIFLLYFFIVFTVFLKLRLKKFSNKINTILSTISYLISYFVLEPAWKKKNNTGTNGWQIVLGPVPKEDSNTSVDSGANMAFLSIGRQLQWPCPILPAWDLQQS